MTQDEGWIGLENIEHGLANHDTTQREVPGGAGLGEGDHVGDHAIVRSSEPGAESTEPGDDLVEDQKNAMRVT